MQRITPGRRVPDFEVRLLDGSTWRLADAAPQHMLMIDFYRGLHCPRCRGHLEAISEAAEEFAAARLDVIAISADSQERAEASAEQWAIANVRLGYGLSIEAADRLGLYLSNAITARPLEPELFTEPAVLFVQPDLTLYGAIIQTFPFARPKIADLLEVPKFVAAQNYPPRGDYRLGSVAEETFNS